MKSVLIDLFTSKKFLAALTAVIVYIAGRFGFDVDTAVLDRLFAAFLVYIGAQGIADHGKSAALIADARAATFGASLPSGLESGAALAKPGDPAILGELRHVYGVPAHLIDALRGPGLLALVVLTLAGSSCTPAQRTATAHAVVDCTAASAGAIGALATSMRGDCAAGTGTDWGCVRSKAISAGLQVGGCAFLELVSGPAARVASATGEPPPERPGVAAFESYRASVAGGAAFRTRDGER